MKDIRKGNDIQYTWTVKNLEGVNGEKVVQLISCKTNEAQEAMTYSISGNVITGTFYGKDQKDVGAYRLLLLVNDGYDNMVTLDKVNAFNLTGVCNFGIVRGADDNAIETVVLEFESEIHVNVGALGEQVQADWDETNTDSPAYIRNKPTIPPAQVQSDWNQSNSSAVDYIKNKPSIYTQQQVDSLVGGEETRAKAAEKALSDALALIEAVIPSAASASNQLADKNFVNSSIATNTATFKGTFDSLAELEEVTGATNNDYGFVIEHDTVGNEYYDRYKYNGTQWLFEYKVESTPFTSDQWAAIQSGITSNLVSKLNALPTATELSTALEGKQDTINDLADIRAGAALGATAVQPAALSGKEDKMAIDSTAKTASFTAAVKNYYFVNIAASGSITVTLTTPTDNSSLQNAVFRVTTSTSPQLIFTAASGISIYKATNYKIEADKIYEVNAQWNGVNWDIANVELEAQS